MRKKRYPVTQTVRWTVHADRWFIPSRDRPISPVTSSDELSALAVSAQLSSGSSRRARRSCTDGCVSGARTTRSRSCSTAPARRCRSGAGPRSRPPPTGHRSQRPAPRPARDHRRGDAASSNATIVVVPTGDDATSGSRLEGGWYRWRACSPRAAAPVVRADTARLSVAHAVAGERARITQELTDHFAQYLHTIVNHLGDGGGSDAGARLQAATSVASRALVESVRSAAPFWRQARRVDEAFGYSRTPSATLLARPASSSSVRCTHRRPASRTPC